MNEDALELALIVALGALGVGLLALSVGWTATLGVFFFVWGSNWCLQRGMRAEMRKALRGGP